MAEGNTLISTSWITYEATAVLMNQLIFLGKIDRQYSGEFAIAGAQKGDEIHIRKPPRFVAQAGPIIAAQNIVETYVTLRLNHQTSLLLNYTSKDLTLSIDNFRERIIMPAVTEVANEMDWLALGEIIPQVPNAVGAPGTLPNNRRLFLDAKAKMHNESTPDDDSWLACLTPDSQASMVDALAGLFNDQGRVSEQYRRGHMGRTTLGFDFYMDQNMPTHVIGALGGTPLVNNTAGLQTGTSLVTNGWTATTATAAKGDRFVIDDVYGVNPKNRTSTGQLRQFVVTANATADGSGNMTIPIYPAIVPPDSLGNRTQFQTVNASPAHAAAITWLGAAAAQTPVNLCFHPKFATLGFADLVPPNEGKAYRVSDSDINIAMRVWEFSDAMTDTHGVRLDVLWGVTVPEPLWACAVMS